MDNETRAKFHPLSFNIQLIIIEMRYKDKPVLNPFFEKYYKDTKYKEKALAELIKRNIIITMKSPYDKRRTYYQLSAKGLSLAETLGRVDLK